MAISDDELNSKIQAILERFPLFGHCMIRGSLKSLGYDVSDNRITASFVCVQGVPGVFGGRTIHCRAYHIAGPNSLWHHDGQHGT